MNSLIQNEAKIDDPTIKELIGVYNEILSELNTHSSKRVNKKIGAVCYYNLGICIYLLETTKSPGQYEEISGAKINNLLSEIDQYRF